MCMNLKHLKNIMVKYGANLKERYLDISKYNQDNRRCYICIMYNGTHDDKYYRKELTFVNILHTMDLE